MPNDYSQRLKDPRWQRKRLEVMERDNWTCRDTYVKDKPLNVHHCWYAKGGPWETPNEYLLTLTEEAHRERQELESRAKKALGRHFANMQLCELQDIVKSLENSEHIWIACSPYDVKDFIDTLHHLGYIDHKSPGVFEMISELFEFYITYQGEDSIEALSKICQYWHRDHKERMAKRKAQEKKEEPVCRTES